MAKYRITMDFYMDGDGDDTEDLKRWIEEALDGGAMGATIISMEEIPDADEEE